MTLLKRLGPFCALLFLHQLVSAQVDKELQEKYWTYRDLHKKKFIKIGLDDGESLPFDNIYPNLGCGAVVGDKIEAGDVMATWGDYVAVLATEYYLLKKSGQNNTLRSVETEIYFALKAFERLDDYGEFHHTGVPQDEQENIFFTRDDMPLEFYKKWEGMENMQFVGSHRANGFVPDQIVENPKALWVSPDDKHPWLPAGSFPCKWDGNTIDQSTVPWKGLLPYKEWEGDGKCGKIIENPQQKTAWKRTGDDMSQDHLLGVMMGYSFIKKFMLVPLGDSEELVLRGTPNSDPIYLKQYIAAKSKQIMEFLSEPKFAKTLRFLVQEEDVDPEDWAKVDVNFAKYNYLIVNPITGKPVNRGFEAFGLSGGYARWGNWMTDESYLAASLGVLTAETQFKIDVPKLFKKANSPSFNLSELILLTAGQLKFMDPIYWYEIWHNWPELYEGLQDHDKLKFKDDKYLTKAQIIALKQRKETKVEEMDVWMNMILRLGVITGSWNHDDFADMAFNQNFPWFEIMYAGFNNKNSKYTQEYYQTILSRASKTGAQYIDEIDVNTTKTDHEGPLTPGVNPHKYAPFNRSSAFSMPNRQYDSKNHKRLYNGLDYMLMHNLYRIVFAEDLVDDTDPELCLCQSTSLDQFGTNNPAAGLPPFRLTSEVKTKARFTDYSEMGIRVPEYIQHAITIDDYQGINGNLKVDGDLVLCGPQAILKVYSGGQITLTSNTLAQEKIMAVRNGAELHLFPQSILRIEDNCKLKISNSGLLRIHPGAKIQIGKNAVLEIDGELKLNAGATYEFEGVDNETGIIRFIKNSEDEGARISVHNPFNSPSPTLKFSNGNRENTILEIVGDFGMNFQEEVNLDISYGTVKIAPKASMFVEGKLDLFHVNIERLDDELNYKAGLVTYGQADITVSNIKIDGGHYGWHMLNFYGGNNIASINHIEVSNCDKGINFEGAAIALNNSNIHHNTIGLASNGANLGNSIQNFGFAFNVNGINQFGTSLSSSQLQFGSQLDQEIGHLANGGSIRALCVDHERNQTAYHMFDNRGHLSANASHDAGMNSFLENEQIFNGSFQSFELDFSSGYNKFSQNTSLFNGVFHPNQQINVDPSFSPAQHQWITSQNYWDNGLMNQNYDLGYMVGTGAHGMKDVVIVDLDQINSASWTMHRSNVCPSQIGTGFLTGYADKSGATGSIINTSSFSDETLSEVYRIINVKFYEEKNYTEVFSLCKEILECEAAIDPIDFDQYVVSHIYGQYIESYTNLWPNTEYTSALLETLENLRLQTGSYWEARGAEIALDMTDVYRLKGNYPLALNTLDQIAMATPEQQSFILKFRCLIQQELDLVSGITSKYYYEGDHFCATTEELFVDQGAKTKKGRDSSISNAANLAKSEMHQADEVKAKTSEALVVGKQFDVYPNPTHESLTVSFELKTNDHVSIQLVSLDGQVVLSKSRKIYKRGKHEVLLDVRHLDKASYILRLEGTSTNLIQRVVID